MNPDYFFSYVVDASVDEPIMLIDRHIGYDEEDGVGIMGDLFQRDLLQLDQMGKKRIQVWINSPGGLVSDGWNIYNAIMRTSTKVDTICIGMAASIAGVIFQAGRKRIMNDYGILMYHNPFGGDDKSLDAIKDSLVKMVSGRSGMSSDAVDKMMKRTTWISAEEAYEMKLCDEIHQSVDFNKKRALVGTDEAEAKNAYYNFKNILNSILPTPNSKVSDMKKVANKLALNLEASEDAIVSEIENREIKAKNLQEAVAKAELEVNNKEKEVADLKDAVAKAEAKAKNAEKELQDAKDAAKKKEDEEAAAKAAAEAEAKNKLETEAKNFIGELVKAGKVKNDAETIKKWEGRAIANLADVQDIFEFVPLNKVANKIETNNIPEADKSRMKNSVAMKMGELQSKAYATK